MLTISLSSALVALLEPQLHTGTPIFHIFGDSSEGKTTGLQLAASVWANPEPGRGTFLSWNSTDNFMLSVLNGNFGVSIAFDESGAVRKRDYTSIIYCLSQGIDRGRLNKDSNRTSPKLWSTVVLSSGENSLIDASNQNSGLRARVIEFLNLPITVSASHAEELKTFSYKNYGILGREFVAVLQAYPQELLLKLHNEWQEAFLENVASAKNIVKRLICILSIILTTAQIVNEKLDMSLDLSLIANFLANYLSEIDRDSLSLTQRAYNVLLDWISGHPHLIAKLGDSGLPTGAVARMVKQNEIAIKSSYFQKLLLENDFSDVKVVAQAFKHAGLLHPEMKDGLQARVTFGATKVQTYRIILKNDID